MAFSKERLEEKLMEMYPEIREHRIDLLMDFDENKGAWVITLRKGEHALSTFLEARDADACMEGDRCVYLGLHIGQFVENFEVHA